MLRATHRTMHLRGRAQQHPRPRRLGRICILGLRLLIACQQNSECAFSYYFVSTSPFCYVLTTTSCPSSTYATAITETSETSAFVLSNGPCGRIIAKGLGHFIPKDSYGVEAYLMYLVHHTVNILVKNSCYILPV